MTLNAACGRPRQWHIDHCHPFGLRTHVQSGGGDLMADFFNWVSVTPAANLLLVMAMAVLVLTITVATILSVIAFFTRVPFEFFGFRVWSSGLTYETGEFIFEDKPKDFWDGSVKGVRSIPRHIEFAKPFIERPQVLVALTKIDVGDGIARIHVSKQSVTRKGFDIRFGTWEDGKLYGASASWLAIGR
jgi:hypothetical protein